MRGEVRRPQIAAAVLDEVAEEGLAALTLAGVAARVGVVPSALYRHFGGKDDLLLAALDLVHERLRAELAAVRGADPLRSLRELLAAHARLIRSHGGIPRIVFSEGVFGTSPRLRARVGRIVEEYLAEVASLVATAQADGRLAREPDSRTLAGLFLGLVQSATVLSRLVEGFDAEEHLEAGWRLFSGYLEVAEGSRR